MKIVIFGASGRMGIKVVEQALEAGHIVTAFLRTPSKIAIQHPKLTLFQGDVTNAVAVENAIAGQEVVISMLHPKKRPPEPGMTTMMETAAKNIVAAMQKQGIRRIISTTGASVPQPEDQPKVADRLINAILNILTSVMDKQQPQACHPEERFSATEGSLTRLSRDASGQKSPLSMTYYRYPLFTLISLFKIHYILQWLAFAVQKIILNE